MAASGSGSGGGSGHALPGLASVLRHMLDVDEEDFDCSIELDFPGKSTAEAATQDTEGPPAKRARLVEGTEAAAPSKAAGQPAATKPAAAEAAAGDNEASEAPAAAVDAADDGVASEASAADISVADLFAAGEAAINEAAAAEGATAGDAAANAAAAGSAAATSIITCRTSSMALKLHSEVFRRWIKGWTGGKKGALRIECEDRQEAEAFQQLLAFVHSAGRTLPNEPVATLRLLGVARKHGVESCVDACLQLLLAQVDQLPLTACLRLVLLLETGASGDEGVQAQADQLLKQIGERLQVLLKEEAAAVAADAALLEDLAAVFGRWHSMLNCAVRRELWRTLPFALLSLMFEDRHVQADTEATVLAAFAMWAKANIAVGPMVPQRRERVAAVCSRIRFPEVPPDVLLNYWTCYKWLQAYDPNKELLLRAADRPPSNAAYARSNEVFWRGYWWCGEFTKSAGSTGLYVRAACPAGMAACVAHTPDRLTYRVKASYKMMLQLGDGAPVNAAATRTFNPGTVYGWGITNVKDSSGQPIPWERFWAADSPILHGGRARLDLTLSVPPS